VRVRTSQAPFRGRGNARSSVQPRAAGYRPAGSRSPAVRVFSVDRHPHGGIGSRSANSPRRAGVYAGEPGLVLEGVFGDRRERVAIESAHQSPPGRGRQASRATGRPRRVETARGPHPWASLVAGAPAGVDAGRRCRALSAARCSQPASMATRTGRRTTGRINGTMPGRGRGVA